MPDYSAQLNQERAKGIKARLAGRITTKIPEAIAQEMTKAVEDKDVWVWPLAYILAIFNDGVDLFGLGAIPLLGDFIDLFCGAILIIFLWDIGGMVRWKVRIAIWAAMLFETIITGVLNAFFGLGFLIELLAFSWTISIWYAHRKVKQKAELAEKGLRQSKRGKISKEIIAEFR